MASHHSFHSHATEGGQESSSKSKLSHDREDAAGEDENAMADKGEAETSSDGQAASDGEEGQECPQTQDTLTSVSQVFGMHEDTDQESDPKEKIQSIWQKWQQSKEDSPPKESSESSSEEELPTDEALYNEAQQKTWQLDTHFDAWCCEKIAKGVARWPTRDTMTCDLPKHGKVQPQSSRPCGAALRLYGRVPGR